ncbi:titin homolog [Aedes aegypti]|uniref:Uncharacterized protein n=1 Tax=Aedes aegypti TaxID=7159 RepID=A0A903VKR5_AEDAE|nr:titin homolog [Aedes aegypti]
MSKEEEVPARVTRGALRRMSVEQEPTPSAPGTPKKTTVTGGGATAAKKLAVLDAIQEGSSNGPSDAELEEDSGGRGAKGKKDTSLVGNRSVHKVKEQDKKGPPNRQLVSSLTEENVSLLDSFGLEVRRTPRRRPSQDLTLTPQTLPKRVTRRNSVTSDDGNLAAATPKASRTRHSIAAPPIIVEDDEKEEHPPNATETAEADLSDLDIRKLRNRSISNSPIPRASPSGKNASMTSGTSPVKAGNETASPQKTELQESESFVDVVSITPVKSGQNQEEDKQEQEKPLKKDVHFDEGTPDQLNKSKYPKTPVAASGEKRRKLSEKLAVEDDDESVSTTSDVIIVDETIKESPKEANQPPATPKTPTKASESPKKVQKITVVDETIKESPVKATPVKASPKTPSKASGTPKKASETPKKAADEPSEEVEESLNESIDASIAGIVDQVREDMNRTDLSMSILGTPKPTKGKSHFSHLREGSSSTPIAAKQAPLDEIPEEEQKDGEEVTPPASKSWSQAVKGSGKGKGIDVFSVRKQEEEEKREEEVKTLNESLKRKSLEKKLSLRVNEEDEEEDEEDEIDASQKRSSFVDDEAMEVDEYESGDSMDSETRAEIENNKADEFGESIGSQDTDEEDEEDEDDDSFIASDGEEVGELLDGTGDDLHSEEEADRSSKKKEKKRKRIVQQLDSSEDEKETSKAEKSTANERNVSLAKSPKKGDTSKRSDVSKTDSVNESKVSVTKSPKKGDTSKLLGVSKIDSPKKTPAKTVDVKSPKKTPAMKSLDKEEVQETSTEDLNASTTVEETTTASPKKNTSLQQGPESPAKVTSSSDVVESPKSPKKTPAKASPQAETKEAKSAEKRRSSNAMEDTSDTVKSRKSLPTPALISADFYSSSAKKAKRNTMDVTTNGNGEQMATEEQSKPSTKEELGNLVTNPAALALAKKNKRLSQGLSPASKQDKRASLPGKLPLEKELDTPLKKKKSGKSKENSGEETNEDSVEPMEVDEEEMEPEETQPSPKKPIVQKKKPKDLSEFDTEAILSRCNEIVRVDREKRKESATLRQKKKDEKRRQREQEKQEEGAEGEADESTEQQKKKKKKKKKQVNYLLEELGETKEDQLARALQRKMAQLEAKRERKKAKKAAKLREQLNKENQQEDGKPIEGIAAKLEKKAKKAKKAEKEKEAKLVVLKQPVPVVKRAISAFAMYSEQIDELKKAKAEKKKPKSKQLKEKNQQPAAPTAVEEVQAALQVKQKKDKKHKHVEVSSLEVMSSPEEHSKLDKKRDVSDTVVEEPVKELVSVKHKKKDKSDDAAPKKKELEKVNTAPLKSVLSLDDELAQFKKSLSEPIAKVVKKQKLSHTESSIATVTAPREVTPPRKTTTGKLKALSRLEAGFHEEPVTPDHKLLKRNHGFKEEPVTPKTIGFKVSSVLPAGQEALKQEAIVAKKKKTYHNTNRIRPEDVKEPAKGLPLPIWTRSGTFEVEELSEGKSKKSSKGSSDYVPLSVNGGAHSSATEFLVKPLGGKSAKREDKTSGGVSKVHRIDTATVDDSVINFKKQAIFGKNAHLREKKSKH